MRLGVIESIDSAHFLPGHETCSRVHGHTYRIELVVEGEKRGGMVVDFYDLKTILRGVLEEFDHRLLNDLLEYPSCENLCEALHRKLEERISLPFTLRVWEGEGKWVEL
jgi:6-pyruvoyltetrahydropterin/6-carboxytetrahydropterin synthase